jgi:hypothetical protein
MNEQLNERVAVEVMGYTQIAGPFDDGEIWAERIDDTHFVQRPVYDYSGDIGAAWRVVEELAKRGCTFDVECTEYGSSWYAQFKMYANNILEDVYGGRVYSHTAPLAICMAALDIVAKLAK